MSVNVNATGEIREPFDICVVGGAGHVGLPIALSFANSGLRVLIFDLNEEALATISSGVMPFYDEGGEILLQNVLGSDRLCLSSDINDISPTGTIVVTIGTPVDEFLNPSHKVIIDCFTDLLPFLTDDHLIVLRSTIFPGTTAWLDNFLASAGKFPKIAFCPERVVQGKGIVELAELPQIISGTSKAAVAKAQEIFESVAPENVVLEPMEAEFAKLFDNCYRYIHFAISNQLYMIASGAGVDYHRVAQGMAYNYPRSQGMPLPGFAAGPCLFKDTMQLAAFSQNQFSLGQAAMQVNEGLVLFIVEKLRQKFALETMSVGLLGMAFKANSDDVRASLSYKMKNILNLHAKKVLTTDPRVKTDPNLLPLDEVLAMSDLFILCVPHDEYKDLNVREKPVIDIWNFLATSESI